MDIDVDRDRYDILKGYLSNKKKSSFATKFPKESQEWHPTKNGILTPNMFSFGSNENVWWLCSKGHEYQMPISERTRGNGCPYCSSHRVLFGYNDLQTQNPMLSKEWHPTKNLPLLPRDVLCTTTSRVWWMCEHGHEWETAVRERVRGHGCPYCANRKVLTGYNDLATTNRKLCLEWNNKKNVGITPETITASSGKKVWWLCSVCGFEWKASIANRNKGNGCPVCAGNVVITGTNDIFTVNAHLKNEWDFDKNATLNPANLTAKSRKRAWWKCKTCGFEWEDTIANRNKGRGCPICKKMKKVN